MLSGTLSKEKLRWITTVFFFLSGIITASWASRIPDVQHRLGLNDAQWGLILFSLPLGLVIGLPVSSWIVAKYSLQVKKEWSTAGYTAYIIAMVSGRLVGDKMIAHYGTIKMLFINGFLMAAGFFIAIVFPYFFTACLGFLLVGLGNSILVPMIYGLAGQSKDMAPGYAIASVTMVGYIGFLTGPLIVGNISESWGMKWAFALMGVLGISVTGITLLVRKHHKLMK